MIKESDGTTTSTWVTVAAGPSAGQYTVSAKPRDEALIGNQTLKLKITLSNYSGHAGIAPSFTITVNAAVCRCARVIYDPPTQLAVSYAVGGGAQTVTIPPATVNAASKTASASIRKCYEGGASCSEAATFVAKMSGNPPTNLRDFIV